MIHSCVVGLAVALLLTTCAPDKEVAGAPAGEPRTEPSPSVATEPEPELAPQSVWRNRFGIYFSRTEVNRVPLAMELGVEYARTDPRIFLEGWDGTCEGCAGYPEAGIRLVLTVRNNGDEQHPTTPPANLERYKTQLAEVLDRIQPAVLVVENEQDAANFYSGTPEDYLRTLAAACEVARARSIACADGGLTFRTVVMMIYQSYLDQGRSTAADDFARRVIPADADYAFVRDPSNADQVRATAEEGWTFIRGYAAAGATHVNFHWYSDDASSFVETVKYLRSETGLPVLSNEIGQHSTDPGTMTSMLQAALDADISYAVWFSFDNDLEDPERGVWALQETDGTLRPHGRAFAEFVQSLTAPVHDRSIDLTRYDTRVTAGMAGSVAGRLVGDVGCRALQTVRLLRKKTGEDRYRRIERTTSKADGSFVLEYALRRAARLKVAVTTRRVCDRAASKVISVSVREAS